MKKIILRLTTITLIILGVSCEKDGGKSLKELQRGGVPNITKISTTETVLNLNSIQNETPINIGLKFEIAQGDIVAMDIVGIYTKGEVIEKAVLKSNLNTFPATANFNQTDLINAFTILNSKADFESTDLLKISADITLRDGTKIELFRKDGTENFSADNGVVPMYNLFQEYSVFCPLNDASLFQGDYMVVRDDWEDYEIEDIVPVEYVTTDGLYTFRILNTNNPYLLNTETYYLVTINPENGEVNVTGSDVFKYNVDPGDPELNYNVTGTGTVETCTGNISLKLKFDNSSVKNFILRKA